MANRYLASGVRIMKSKLNNQVGSSNLAVGNWKCIMTSSRANKIFNNLESNPYFDKYAKKIHKLQQTNPEEFLQRFGEQEKKIEKKDSPIMLKKCFTKSSWLFISVLSKVAKSQVYQIRRYSSSTLKDAYITTPIFYVNSDPHIGHLYTVALADAIARYKSMLGHSVILSTGTDEHGSKIAAAAERKRHNLPKYCAYISNRFRLMCDSFEIDYFDFVRTTEERHAKAVQHFWNVLEEKGHIYSGKYSGWYCKADESYVSENEIIHKNDGSTVSAISNNPVHWTEENNYIFRLSSFQDDLRYWLRQDTVVQPDLYQKTLLSWIEDGYCKDLSISRNADKVPWAISTPNNDSQTIYVWFDALVNYLTAVGYPDDSYKQRWPPSVQVFGKDILRFHGIYWPAMLLAAGLELPERLLCHGHWTIDGTKMSKSRNNVVSPFQAAEIFTNEGLRYFLLRGALLDKDSNYNENATRVVLNNELANTLGNLILRCSSSQLNPLKEFPSPAMHVGVLKSEAALQNKKLLNSLQNTAQTYYESCSFHYLVDSVMRVLRSANNVLEIHRPWVDQCSPEEVTAVVSLIFENVRVSALVLYPIIPKYSKAILDYLNIPEQNRTWKDVTPQYLSARGETLSISQNVNIRFEKLR